MKIKFLFLLSTISLLMVSCNNMSTDTAENNGNASMRDLLEGQELYKTWCQNCHNADGTGLAKLYPPLADADYLRNNQDKIACIIKDGLKGEIVVNGQTYNQNMVGFSHLNEHQITSIINYINTSWGNKYPLTDAKKVGKELKKCK